MGEKRYTDPEWLQRKWIDEDWSVSDIAEECDISERTVRKYIHEDYPEIGVYDCPEDDCNKSFKKERNLNFHITSVHENESATNKYIDDGRKHKNPEWVQAKLEDGYNYEEISEMCVVGVDSIRRIIRENNLGIYKCSVENCNQRYPTEGGMKQHLSRDHPDVEYEGYGLDLKHVREKNRQVRMEMIEDGVGQYSESEMLKNLEKAHKEFDPKKHSEFIQKVWENKDPEEYHQRRDGWWEKHAESRDDWGPKQIEVEETGNIVASSWEKEIDLMLYKNGIDYMYEGKTYEIKNTWNTPDFEGDDWIIEVKGYVGFRDKDRYQMIGKYFVEDVDKTYILVAGDSVDMPCDVRIDWEERGDLFDILS